MGVSPNTTTSKKKLVSGSRIIEVNEIRCENLPHQEILDILRDQSMPMRIRFRPLTSSLAGGYKPGETIYSLTTLQGVTDKSLSVHVGMRGTIIGPSPSGNTKVAVEFESAGGRWDVALTSISPFAARQPQPKWTCPGCSHENDPTNVFCTGCGLDEI